MLICNPALAENLVCSVCLRSYTFQLNCVNTTRFCLWTRLLTIASASWFCTWACSGTCLDAITLPFHWPHFHETQKRSWAVPLNVSTKSDLVQGASPVRGARTVRRDSSQRSQGSLGLPQSRSRQQLSQMQAPRPFGGRADWLNSMPRKCLPQRFSQTGQSFGCADSSNPSRHSSLRTCRRYHAGLV